MALGAASTDILRLILAEGARMAAAGVAAGALLALAGTRALGSLLFGVSPIESPDARRGRDSPGRAWPLPRAISRPGPLRGPTRCSRFEPSRRVGRRPAEG